MTLNSGRYTKNHQNRSQGHISFLTFSHGENTGKRWEEKFHEGHIRHRALNVFQWRKRLFIFSTIIWSFRVVGRSEFFTNLHRSWENPAPFKLNTIRVQSYPLEEWKATCIPTLLCILCLASALFWTHTAFFRSWIKIITNSNPNTLCYTEDPLFSSWFAKKKQRFLHWKY